MKSGSLTWMPPNALRRGNSGRCMCLPHMCLQLHPGSEPQAPGYPLPASMQQQPIMSALPPRSQWSRESCSKLPEAERKRKHREMLLAFAPSVMFCKGSRALVPSGLTTPMFARTAAHWVSSSVHGAALQVSRTSSTHRPVVNHRGGGGVILFRAFSSGFASVSHLSQSGAGSGMIPASSVALTCRASSGDTWNLTRRSIIRIRIEKGEPAEMGRRLKCSRRVHSPLTALHLLWDES